MQHIHNIQKVSQIFFIVIGFINLISGSLFFSAQETSLSPILFKTSFIPFIICALAYSLSSLRLNIYNYSGNDSSNLDLIFLSIAAVITIGISIIFFALPNF